MVSKGIANVKPCLISPQGVVKQNLLSKEINFSDNRIKMDYPNTTPPPLGLIYKILQYDISCLNENLLYAVKFIN